MTFFPYRFTAWYSKISKFLRLKSMMSQLSNALSNVLLRPLDQILYQFEVQKYHCQSASLRRIISAHYIQKNANFTSHICSLHREKWKFTMKCFDLLFANFTSHICSLHRQKCKFYFAYLLITKTKMQICTFYFAYLLITSRKKKIYNEMFWLTFCKFYFSYLLITKTKMQILLRISAHYITQMQILLRISAHCKDKNANFTSHICSLQRQECKFCFAYLLITKTKMQILLRISAHYDYRILNSRNSVWRLRSVFFFIFTNPKIYKSAIVNFLKRFPKHISQTHSKKLLKMDKKIGACSKPFQKIFKTFDSPRSKAVNVFIKFLNIFEFLLAGLVEHLHINFISFLPRRAARRDFS